MAQWLRGFGVDEDAIARPARRGWSGRWSAARASGRVAYQFAKDYAGRHRQ